MSPPPVAKKAKHDDATTAAEAQTKAKKPPPSYQSQDYWEKRYKKHRIATKPDSSIATSSTLTIDDDDDSEPLPYYAWYFTYSELRPLILPVILGGRDKADEFIQNRDDESTESSSVVGDKEEQANSPSATKRDDGDDVQSDEDEGERNYDQINDEGLAKCGPISVLEVGCGDMPLGKDLALDFDTMAQTTGAGPEKIVKRIVCCDYSNTVIEMMKEEQLKAHPERTVGGTPSLTVEYVVADARKLQYPDGCFDFVIEKGTLDAMLSDKEKGADDCKTIIAECARILSSRGCIMLVSHVNAHTLNGLDWLEKVVIPGLREGGGRYTRWLIEVHGNDGQSSEWEDVEEVVEEEITDENGGPSVQSVNDMADVEEDDEEDEDSRASICSTRQNPSGSPGPAVYMIYKSSGLEEEFEEPKDDRYPPVPIKFYSY